MITIFVDFNEMARPGCVIVHARMQPTGALPGLTPGDRVLLREYGDDEKFAAMITRDTISGDWLADMDAAVAIPPGPADTARAEH